MAIVVAVTAPGGLVYCLTEEVHVQRVPIVLPLHLATYATIAWLARRELGRKYTGFLMAILVAAISLSMTLGNAWLRAGPPLPAGLLFATLVPMMVGIFVPWRPLLTIALAIPVLLAIYATHRLLGIELPLPASTMANAAFSIAVCSAIGIQAQRRLWWRFERTRKQLSVAEREANARSVETAQRAAEIRGILDNVGDGFLRLDLAGRMSNERSAILTRWFGAADADMSFADYLRRVDPTQASSFELGWSQITDDLLPLDVCVEQLPSRISAGELTLSIRYRPVLEGAALRELIVIVADVTAQVERERAEAEIRDLLGALRSILRDREAFADFAREGTKLVHEVSAADTALPVLLRQLHTLKGNSAMFELDSISRLCHAIETRVLAGEAGLSPADRQLLAEAWEPVASLAGTDSEAGRLVLDVDVGEQALVMRMLALVPSRPDVMARLRRWHLEPSARQLIRLGDRAQATALRLQKGPIDVVIEDGGVRLPKREWAPLWSALVHVIRNAIDHGLETADARRAAGKAAIGKLTLSTAFQGDQVVLVIADDGCGVDWEAIRSRAAAQGLAHSTHSDLLRALLTDGITSRSEATEVSGRGVGMAAVLEACARLGGTIDVQSLAGRGTSVILRLPTPETEDAAVGSHGSGAAAVSAA
ncbi:MAG: ATP-binding protein [Deltaproteobacteria bacterium]